MNLYRSVEWLEKSLNRDFEVEVKGERISEEATNEIAEYLPVCMMDEDWDAVGFEPVTSKGRFARRLSAYIYKNFQEKLPADTVERIGNIANRYTVSGGVFVVRADRELWRPGTFGDDGSCFWGGRRAAPQLIFRHGGAGIKMYDSNRVPLGRAWIAPRLGRGVIFNPYTVRGKKTLTPSNVGEIVTAEGGPFEKFGMGFIADLRNYGYTNETVWINNGRGVVIYPSGLEWDGDFMDLRIKYGPVCSSCGELHDSLQEYQDAWYCPQCWPIQACSHCNAEHHRDTMLTLESEQYCLSCFSILTRRCVECEEIHIGSRMVYDGGHKYFCPRCWTRRATARSRANTFLSSMAGRVASGSHSVDIDSGDVTYVLQDTSRITSIHGEFVSSNAFFSGADTQEATILRDRLQNMRGLFTDIPLPECGCSACNESRRILERLAQLEAAR